MKLSQKFMLAMGLLLVAEGCVWDTGAAHRKDVDLAADYTRAATCDAKRAAGKSCANDDLASVARRDGNEKTRRHANSDIIWGAVAVLAAGL